MAKTINKIIYSIREKLEEFSITDDSKITPDFIKEKIFDVRSLLIKEIRQNKKGIPDAFYQKICCLEVKCATIECEVGYPFPEAEYYIELPSMEALSDQSEIKYLGKPNFKLPWTRVNVSGFLSTEGNIYTANEPRYTIVGSIAWIKNLPTTGTTYVCLIGLLDEPYTSCDWNDASILPIPRSMIYKLELLIVKEVFEVLGRRIPDVLNDALASPDNLVAQQPQQTVKK